MAESYSSKLQIWEGFVPPLVKHPAAFALGNERGLAMAAPPLELAERLCAFETFGHRTRARPGVEPFSLQWYLEIEADRHGRHGHWVPRLLEFGKHSGDRLLCMGSGLGTDWVQYARQGAEVIACSPDVEQRSLVQRGFALRGLPAQLLHAPPTALPLEAASIDVVCLSSLLQADVDPAAVIEEVYRVLKPGGKVLALTRAYFDVDFWCYRWLPWRHWLKPHDPTASPRCAYKARQVRRLFGRFVEHSIYKRYLRRSSVPHLWRWLPLPLLERLLGQILVVKAFKPLSAAIPTPLAA